MVVVFGPGRSGTNLVLEILSGSKELLPTLEPETKDFFANPECIEFREDYVTKCDTLYCNNFGVLGTYLKDHPHLRIIYTIRHPFDLAVSKLLRGWASKSADASFGECLTDIYWAAHLHHEATNEFPDKILTVKLEDVLLDIETEARRICEFLKISFEYRMCRPYDRMRIINKYKRYGDKIDKSQIDIYKRWKELNDGFLVKELDFNMEDLFDKIIQVVNYFGYKDERVI